MTEPRTMLDKVWAQHVIVPRLRRVACLVTLIPAVVLAQGEHENYRRVLTELGMMK